MNWVLATLCVFFFSKLKGSSEPAIRYWSWFFLLFGVSLFFGGFSHLLYEYLGQNGKIPGWSAAIFGVSCGESAMLAGIDSPKLRQTLSTVIRSKLFATFVLLFFDLSFTWVMVHTAGFWLMVGTISYNRMKSGQAGYRYFLYGMSTLLLMAIVKVGEIDIDPAWFNRDDIAHFIMIGMYWMFYRGVVETNFLSKSVKPT